MTEESLNNFINIAIIFKTQQTHGVSIQRRRQQSEKSLQVPIFRQEKKRKRKKFIEMKQIPEMQNKRKRYNH